jgi:hypothetical protein
MGIAIIIGAPFFAVRVFKASTFTFDKSRDCILWEQRSFLRRSTTKSVEFPTHLIAGVEIMVSTDMEETGYYPRLILESIYWRIPLNSNGRYENAVTLAKTLAQFLSIDYFPDESKAPIPTWLQKTSSCAEPWQPHWQYLQNEADRLRHHIIQYPQDAEAHQDLGIFLYCSNRLNRNESVVYLQQAEKLFELQQDKDSAAIARLIQALISWGY